MFCAPRVFFWRQCVGKGIVVRLSTCFITDVEKASRLVSCFRHVCQQQIVLAVFGSQIVKETGEVVKNVPD